MKSRILTAAVLIIAALAIIFSNNIYVYLVATIVMSSMCCYELLKALKLLKQPFLAAVTLAASIASPILMLDSLFDYIFPAFVLYFVLFFLSVIVSFNKVDLSGCGILFTMSMIIFVCNSSLIRIVSVFPQDAIFYIILLLFSAFITDSCAFFTGKLIGKHKLIPSVSPNKTIEGSIGGLVGCVIVNVLYTFIYSAVFLKDTASVNYIALIIISVVTAFAGMIGDLAASTVKRICGIKDFGNLLPGHGGLLDRLDSMNFTVPAGLALLIIFPIIIR